MVPAVPFGFVSSQLTSCEVAHDGLAAACATRCAPALDGTNMASAAIATTAAEMIRAPGTRRRGEWDISTSPGRSMRLEPCNVLGGGDPGHRCMDLSAGRAQVGEHREHSPVIIVGCREIELLEDI